MSAPQPAGLHLRRILVPLDGSQLSEAALPLAALLARTTGASVALVRTVWAMHGAEPDVAAEQRLGLDAAALYLAGVAERLRATVPHVTAEVRAAPAAAGILRQVERGGADLIVMTTHGRSGLGRWVYGSVAEEVLADCPVPVLLVRGPADGVVTEWGRKRLLVPLDGSPASDAVLPHAAAMARALDATLVLLHVTPPTLEEEGDGIDGGSATAPEAEPGAHVHAVAEALRSRGLRAVTTLRSGRSPAAAITDEIALTGAGMVAMSTHGRTGLPRLIFGSVTSEVLRRADVPLLVVRSVETAGGPLGQESVKPWRSA